MFGTGLMFDGKIMKKLILEIIFAASACSLYAQVNTLSDCEKQEGFNLLFDGTLASFQSNWTPYKKGSEDNTAPPNQDWKLEAATNAIITTVSTPDIRSKQKYTDFDLRLSFRNTHNQGIYYRALTTGDEAWATGVEFAIDEKATNPLVVTGSAYDLFPVVTDALNDFATGLWNEARIVVKGNLDAAGKKSDSVEHWLNGRRIVAFRYGSPAFWTAYAAHKWAGYPTFCQTIPGNKSSTPIPSGYLGFQANHTGLWKIRNLRINSTSTVKLGGYKFPPDACSVSTGAPSNIDGAKISVTTEHVTGAVRLQFAGAKIDAVILMALNGHQISKSRVDQNTQSATLSGWSQPGIYIIKAMESGASRHTEKIFLQ